MELKEIFTKKAKEIAIKMWEENNDKTVVGGEETVEFEIDNKKLNINVIAFWESLHHLEFVVKDEDGNILQSRYLIEF